MDVNITLYDGLEGNFMDAIGFHAQIGRLEEVLGVAEPLITNGDYLIVRQLIALLQEGAGGHCLKFRVT